MAYADYAYYKETYHGTMPEADFLRLARQATAYLDQITFGRIAEGWQAMEAVKDACCAVADMYLLLENGGGIASETNDGISVDYVAGISNTMPEGKRLYRVAALYLSNTGLMYRGVERC